MHARDVLLQRQPFKADIAGDAFANRCFYFTKGLCAPVRIGIQGAAHGNKIRTAVLQQFFTVRRINHTPGHQHGNRHHLLDGLGIGAKTSARKRWRLYAIFRQLRTFVAATRQIKRRNPLFFKNF